MGHGISRLPALGAVGLRHARRAAAAGLVAMAMAGWCAADALKDKVDGLVKPLIAEGVAPAVVVGVVTNDATQVYPYGRLSKTDPRPPDGQTLFEIGSITKVFTGILLADLIERGDVRGEDPVGKCLPEGVHLPTWDGRAITLEHLATHTSGLPRIPLVLAFRGLDDPYAREDAKQLYAVLDGMMLWSEPGKLCSYSNLGYALLGQALVEKSRIDYQTLVVQRICQPLGLTDTRITLSEDQRKRLAPGHRGGKTVSNWTFKAYAPAGALRSTATDLCRFLRANMGLADAGPLSKALPEAQRPRQPMDQSSDVGFAWITTRLPDSTATAVWHNGGTGGYSSFIGFLKDQPVGVVVLMNSMSETKSAETVLGLALLAQLGAANGR